MSVPKHSIIAESKVMELLQKFNISRTQLPKIKINDRGIPDGAIIGDVILIERREKEGKPIYYRVVVP